jgi:hypothetical protein
VVFEDDDTPMAIAKRLAVLKFAEQAKKGGGSMSWIREAFLEITKSTAPDGGYVNGCLCSGYVLKFVAQATTDLGKMYESTTSMFVAPHNPNLELRRNVTHL